MNDIRRADLHAWGRAAGDPMLVRVHLLIALIGAIIFERGLGWPGVCAAIFLTLLSHSLASLRNSIGLRFRTGQFRSLWSGCQDRLARFEEALKRMSSPQLEQLDDMPDRIRALGQTLYLALRRADMIAFEVQQSEDGLTSGVTHRARATTDSQSQELYQIADRNAAEYRQQLAAIMASVQRTEAQAVVFMTAVDTLRMKMVGYRLNTRTTAIPDRDLLAALTEARMQFESIDHALDELGLPHVSVAP
jgi:hypothetical protein